MKKLEIINKRCEKCNKNIQAINEAQLEWNYNMHLKFCKGKRKVKYKNE